MPIRRIFIANRGEIAVRIIRSARDLGIETVLGVSMADRDSLGAKLATRAVCLGPGPSRESYLKVDTVVQAALGTGCDAVHPGYGFLSENCEYRLLPETLSEEPYGLAFRKASDPNQPDSLKNKVNEALQAMRADGTLKRLNKRWILQPRALKPCALPQSL